MTGRPARQMRLALVEYLDDAEVVADVVIALSPVALQQCFDRNIEATVIDDHIERLALLEDQIEYLRWQVSWVSRLDEAAALRGSARVAALSFKGPMDTAILTSRLLRQIFRSLNPTHIIYVDRTRTEPNNDTASGGLFLWGDDSGPRPIGRLIEAVCFDFGISLERIVLPAIVTSSEPQTFRARLRRALGPIIGPRRSLRPHIAKRSEAPAVVMTWYGGYGARSFVRSQSLSGRRVLYLVRGRSFTALLQPALFWWRRRSPRFALNGHLTSSLPSSVWAIIDEIDLWSGTPGTGRIVGPRLERVLRTMCPAVEAIAGPLGHAFRVANVERLACANPSSTEEFAAMLAAARFGIPRQLVQHGDHLMGYEPWVGYEVSNFEEWACSDPTVPADLEAICDAVSLQAPRFTIASYRSSEIRRASGNDDRQPICYVPTFFQAGCSLFGPTLDDAWYYRWQRRLVAWMAAQGNRSFIWKAFPPANHAEDPIPALLARDGVANIRYDTRPLTVLFGSVGRIVVDLPSTALFEAVQAGVPTLSLSFPRFIPLRPAAADLFRPILRECKTEVDAIQEVARFLAEDRSLWTLDLTGLISFRRTNGPDEASSGSA